jgi:pyruvate kinase
MLSDETAQGKHPIEAVTMMEKIVLEAEKHVGSHFHINPL